MTAEHGHGVAPRAEARCFPAGAQRGGIPRDERALPTAIILINPAAMPNKKMLEIVESAGFQATWLADVPQLKDAFQKGEDIHAMTLANLNGEFARIVTAGEVIAAAALLGEIFSTDLLERLFAGGSERVRVATLDAMQLDGATRCRRNTPRVTVAKSGSLGKPKSEAVEAVARVLPKSETRAVYNAILKRYWYHAWWFYPHTLVRGGIDKVHVGLEITPSR